MKVHPASFLLYDKGVEKYGARRLFGVLHTRELSFLYSSELSSLYRVIKKKKCFIMSLIRLGRVSTTQRLGENPARHDDDGHDVDVVILPRRYIDCTKKKQARKQLNRTRKPTTRRRRTRFAVGRILERRETRKQYFRRVTRIILIERTTVLARRCCYARALEQTASYTETRFASQPPVGCQYRRGLQPIPLSAFLPH